MKSAPRRTARLEARLRKVAGPAHRRYTRCQIEYVQFPGWDKLFEMGYKPGDDHPWLRKSP